MAGTTRTPEVESKGYAQYTLGAGAISLTAAPTQGVALPADAAYAIFSVETQDVRWRHDGTAPTAAIGVLLRAGTDIWWDGDLNDLQFIRVAAGAVLNVAYFG